MAFNAKHDETTSSTDMIEINTSVGFDYGKPRMEGVTPRKEGKIYIKNIGRLFRFAPDREIVRPAVKRC